MLEIAQQKEKSYRSVTYCYTSLESMNMRSWALLNQAMERSTFLEGNSVPFRITLDYLLTDAENAAKNH